MNFLLPGLSRFTDNAHRYLDYFLVSTDQWNTTVINVTADERMRPIESRMSCSPKDQKWTLASPLVLLYGTEPGLGEQRFCWRLQKSQCLFNDYYSLLCNYDGMGTPAQSRELSESNDSNLQPCGFVWMLKCLVCSIACLMGLFPTYAVFPPWMEITEFAWKTREIECAGKGGLTP